MRSGWLRCVVIFLCLVFLLSCSSSKTAFLYLVSQGTSPGTVTPYSLNLNTGLLNSSDGALVQAGKSANTGTQPTVLVFDPTQTFAYVADFGNPLGPGSDNTTKYGDVALFTVNSNGSLNSVGLTNEHLPCITYSPVALAMDSGAHFLFVANKGFANVDTGATCPGAPPNGTPAAGVLTVYQIGSGGKLTLVADNAIPTPTGVTLTPTPTGVGVSNQGNFVYVTDSVNNTAVGFSYDTTSGTLATVPGQFFVVGTAPSSAFSPAAGNFLYVANASSNDIFEFVINTDGSLSPITNSTTTVAAGVGPTAMIADPSAKYFYVIANGGSQVIGYTFNHVTGALTPLSVNGGVVSTGANPVAITIRSTGSTNGNFWLFTSNNGASSVSTFALEITTGTLTPLPQITSPFAPYGIAVR
jgi:6-phosphogluconolactonase (cycloisomerase 2 family)